MQPSGAALGELGRCVTRRRQRRLTRDGLLFALGAGGFLYLLLAKGGERPTYMLACLALMGVPAFLPSKRKDDE